MKIGVVVDNEFTHDHRVQKEVRLLQGKGHSVHVLCFDFGNTYSTNPYCNVQRIQLSKKIKDGLVLLSTNFKWYDFFWAKHIASFIKINKLEALHVHDLYMSKAAYWGIEKSGNKIPFTLDLHENYPAAINTYQWATKGWRKFIVTPKKWYLKEKEYLKYPDTLITLSNSFKNNLLKRFSFLKREAIFVHPNMPDFDSFLEFENTEFSVNFSSKTPVLFYFGVVAKRRGIIEILPWLIDLLNEGFLFHILIIGPIDKADKSRFQAIIQNPLLKNHLTYVAWSDVKFLPAYLKKISIGLAPFEVNEQHNSGVANKLFQYMYGEIPILATKCKAQQELIEEAKCGLLYENEKSFKSALTLLLKQENYRKQLGSNGKKKLLQFYKEKVDCDFLEIYTKNY